MQGIEFFLSHFTMILIAEKTGREIFFIEYEDKSNKNLNFVFYGNISNTVFYTQSI